MEATTSATFKLKTGASAADEAELVAHNASFVSGKSYRKD
jgi:hypothetical protein